MNDVSFAINKSDSPEEIIFIKKNLGLMKHIWLHKWLYLMLVPGILYFAIFRYGPMFGIVMAFQNFHPTLGIGDSPWVGLMWFREFFGSPDFLRIMINTMSLGVLSITLGFSAPIIFALLLNELKGAVYKRCVQTAIYVPHFVSWAIVSALTIMLFNSNGGFMFDFLENIFGRPVNILTNPSSFRWMILLQGIWKNAGFGTIIYLAALSSVDPELYEAAIMDGAGRWRRLWHITLPAIRPIVVIMLILACGNFLSTGFEQIYLMQNSLNRPVALVFDLFVYQIGIQRGMFSYATAVGLFNSVVGIVLVVTANLVAKKVDPEAGIF